MAEVTISNNAKYTVELKPGHPTGEYRRGGGVWRFEPQEVLGKNLADSVLADPWLTVKDSKGNILHVDLEAVVQGLPAPETEPAASEPEPAVAATPAPSEPEPEPDAQPPS